MTSIKDPRVNVRLDLISLISRSRQTGQRVPSQFESGFSNEITGIPTVERYSGSFQKQESARPSIPSLIGECNLRMVVLKSQPPS